MKNIHSNKNTASKTNKIVKIDNNDKENEMCMDEAIVGITMPKALFFEKFRKTRKPLVEVKVLEKVSLKHICEI